jgi:hypothetical protein
MAELQGFTFLFGGLLGAGGVGDDALTLSGIAAGAPACGQPSLSQNHSLTASVVASGSPVCGTTTLTQNHGLTATGLAAGSPVLQGTALGQNHAFTLSGLATGSPVCGTLVLGQVHVFSVVAVSAGLPQLGNPTIQSTGAANWWIYWYSFEVMTMQKNQAGQSITMLAIDTATGKPKTGDAANLTAYVSKDDGAVTVLGDVSAAETDATNAKGLYAWTLTQAETNADKLVFSGKSTTTNVELIPVIVYTISEMDANIVSANGLPVLTGQFNFAVSAGGRMINNVLDIVPGDEYIAADNTAVSFTDSKFPNLSLFDSAELTVSVAGVAVVDHVSTTELDNSSKTVSVELTEAQTTLLADYVGEDAFFDLELVRADATKKTVARGPVNILDPLG